MKSRFRKRLTILFIIITLALYALQMLALFKPELITVKISYSVYFILIALYAVIIDAVFYFKYREIYLAKLLSTAFLVILAVIIYAKI